MYIIFLESLVYLRFLSSNALEISIFDRFKETHEGNGFCILIILIIYVINMLCWCF